MTDNRLYAVDADDATPPTGGNRAPARSRSPQKARPRYAVPTDRMRFEVQEKALRVICLASRGGVEPVDSDKMAAHLHVPASKAALNNAFFVSVGLVEKSGKGDYLPTSIALDYQRKHSFDRRAAAALIAPCFTDTWFHDAVCQQLDIGAATRDQLIATLAAEAHTDDSYSVQYGMLLDWLEYVGLITTVDGRITVSGKDAERPADDRLELDTPDSDPRPAPIPEQDAAPRVAQPFTAPSSAVLSLTFSVNLSLEDLAALSADQIAALFDGVGRVAAVKAAVSGAG